MNRRTLLLAGTAALVAGPGAVLRAAEPAPSPPSAAELAALEGRAAGIRAVREVKRLQHAWAQFAEAGQWAEMAALVAEDAELSVPPAVVKGRAAIHAWIVETMGGGAKHLAPGRLNVRLFLSPVITLAPDCRSAKGRWHEVAMTGEHGARADWAGGIHENDYVVEDGAWKIKALRYHPQFAGPYQPGWRNVAAEVPLVPYHYTPDGAGTPIPAGIAAAVQGSASRRLARLAGDAEVLAAATHVQNLQAAYGFYTDRKLWDDVADLFAPDGVLEDGGAVMRGRAAIRASLGASGLAEGELNDRPQLVPVVTVAADGRSARVRGIEIGQTGQHRGKSFWSVAIYDNRFEKRDGVWRIAAMKRTPRMRADYAAGWAKDLPELPGSAAYPAAAGPRAALAPRLAPPAKPARAPDWNAIRRDLDFAEAFDGAENVSNAYGYYIDEYRWDDTADLFAADGWKELSYIGTYVGRERVRGSLFSRYGNKGRSPGFLAIHQKTQPFVSISEDGARVNIRLRLFQFNSQRDGDGSYISGIYENQVTRENGVWRIHGMDLDYVWLASYTGGWAAIEPGSSRRFAPTPEAVAKYPPDAPLRGVQFAPFPEIAPMGFHFRNPVSGRAPALLLGWSDGRRS
ncbi:nuclear transport factor 2 family protein [Sphingomonas canadensis]|uniref:Nuclear transport factor 2 family protein n=1 Tax=Sphingomonas canadensis TaxID=1219257 RepID=A0ABW3H3A8_9SPHN|nr:nuclear transport factor 2 family protein [Sphingomonas canadensis]MCW3835630.1 nuclear transport factor 2 family protein [Sphingomonas canadensis]